MSKLKKGGGGLRSFPAVENVFVMKIVYLPKILIILRVEFLMMYFCYGTMIYDSLQFYRPTEGLVSLRLTGIIFSDLI